MSPITHHVLRASTPRARSASPLFFAALLVASALAPACSKGEQTLYVASDRPDDLTVTINGERQVMTTRGLGAYASVKLTKGAEVVVEAGGAEVDRATLPAVDKGDAALFLVGGAHGLALVDYRPLYSLKTSTGPARAGQLGLGPLRRDEIAVVQVDRVSKTVVFDRRAAVVGPESLLPGAAGVNQFTFDKFPVYRLERVPVGADPFETVAPRVTKELGRDKLPGGGGRR